jgi:hypothetical protein
MPALLLVNVLAVTSESIDGLQNICPLEKVGHVRAENGRN